MAGHRTHRPALSSDADAHALAPSIFLCYSSCGPQHGKREAPCNIPSPSDVAHSVRARRKPAATQSDSEINTNSLLLKRSYCAGHPGGTRLWEPARVRSKVTLNAVPSRCSLCLPLSLKVSRARSQLSAGPGTWPCLAAAVSAGVCPSSEPVCIHRQAQHYKTSRFGLVHGAEWGIPPWGCCDLFASAVPLKRKQEADPQNPGICDMAKDLN